MNLTAVLLFAAMLCTGMFKGFPQGKVIKSCISPDEQKLYSLIMKYRKDKGLPEIPLSKSLTYVARVHAKDLAENPPAEGCNMHSWSSKGQWKPCCYTPDHKQASCMWDKPSELTNYKADGFEISHGGSGAYVSTPEKALEGWKNSKGHNAVIINDENWKNNNWKAIGIGMYQNYSVVWFGEEEDKEGKPEPCK